MLRELPIFPLPLVLFPGAVQPLHIFEARYRELLADVLAADRRFGIAYVAPAPPGAPPASPAPGDVGCTAEIADTQALPDGRSNIVTVGTSRFTLIEWLASERSYRLARVEEFDDDPADPAEAGAVTADVRRDYQRLLAALAVLTDRSPSPSTEPPELPADPQALSFHVAARLELDVPRQLELLRLRSTVARLRHLAALLAPLAVEANARAAVRALARRNGKSGLPADIERADG